MGKSLIVTDAQGKRICFKCKNAVGSTWDRCPFCDGPPATSGLIYRILGFLMFMSGGAGLVLGYLDVLPAIPTLIAASGCGTMGTGLLIVGEICRRR